MSPKMLLSFGGAERYNRILDIFGGTMRKSVRVVLYTEIVLFSILAIASARAMDFREKADLLVENLVEERFEAVVETFRPQLAAAHGAGELQEIWFKAIQRYGPYQDYQFGEAVDRDTLISYLYTLKFGSAVLAVVAAYDAQGQVTAFILQPPQGEAVLAEPGWIVPAFTEASPEAGPAAEGGSDDAYSEIDFSMMGATPLPATMTVAKTNEANPVVLFIDGFYRPEEFESGEPLPSLRTLTRGLARQGIASVRFECRAFVQEPDSLAGYNLDQYLLDDIAAMLAYIRMESDILDTARIFIAGYGPGGMVVPMAADRDGGLAGVMLISTPSRPIPEWMDSIRDPGKKKTGSGLKLADKLQQRRLSDSAMVLLAPARVWYELMDSSYVKQAGRLKIPTFILQSGGNSGAMEEDLNNWRKALSGRSNVVFKSYDYADYFRRPGGIGEEAVESEIDAAPVSRQIVDDLGAWIKSK
jgi:hypothetical protein